MYAGTHSLSKELKSVSNVSDIRIGDVFIQGGFPGHAVLVVNIATRKKDKIFLLAQSYMPAQELQILCNPNKPSSPWFYLNNEKTIQTPEWQFSSGDLKRFVE